MFDEAAWQELEGELRRFVVDSALPDHSIHHSIRSRILDDCACVLINLVMSGGKGGDGWMGILKT